MPASHDAGIHSLMDTNLKITSKTNNLITYEEQLCGLYSS